MFMNFYSRQEFCLFNVHLFDRGSFTHGIFLAARGSSSQTFSGHGQNTQYPYFRLNNALLQFEEGTCSFNFGAKTN